MASGRRMQHLDNKIYIWVAILFASRGRHVAVSFVSCGRLVCVAWPACVLRVAVLFVLCASRLHVACSLGAHWVRCYLEGCAVMAREGRAGSGIDRLPSAPQVRMVGFLAMSPAQVTRGVPLWPRRVGLAQVLTGCPPPLRYVVGFSAPWFYCVDGTRVYPTGGVPVWPGRVRLVALRPVALCPLGAYRYPRRYVGSCAPHERCAM